MKREDRAKGKDETIEGGGENRRKGEWKNRGWRGTLE